MCEICKYVDDHPAPTNVFHHDVAVAKAYIAGFAQGFNLRTETTYTELCQLHADWMRAALLAAGSKPVELLFPVRRSGST